MRVGSVCSGIEAASVAWRPLGWETVFTAEIDPFPCCVLDHHYTVGRPHVMPNPSAANIKIKEARQRAAAIKSVLRRLPERPDADTPNFGDLTRYEEWTHDTAFSDIDVLVGGTPCQSFSVAGPGKGLDDPRGQLAFKFLDLAGDIRPRWVVWENVPGVLSSNGGRDFAAFVGALEKLGYGWAYRVLDAQYVIVDGFAHAVPQRRQRVFLVGYLGDARPAQAVLFEPESLSGHPAPRRCAGQSFAHATAPSLTASGRGVDRSGESRGQDPVVAFGGNDTRGPIDVATACNARGGAGRMDFDTETFVAHTLKADGFDASEDGTGRGVPLVPMDGSSWAFSCKDHGGDALDDVAPTLRAMNHDGSHANAGGQIAVAIQERAVAENPDSGPDGVGVRDDGAAYTLEARSTVQAVATLAVRGRNDGADVEWRDDGTANAVLTPSGGKGGTGVGAVAMLTCGDRGVSPDQAAANMIVPTPMSVRRLTCRECERLQGYPDDYTLIPNYRSAVPDVDWVDMAAYHGVPVHVIARDGLTPDGPRYKALGNSKPVNVTRWIGLRIQMCDAVIAGVAR